MSSKRSRNPQYAISSSRRSTKLTTPSQLVLTGNSCALAPWYATLGFVKETFIASLESLTHTGGVAPLLDIVITRLYGTGYVDTKSRKTEVWNAEEEREKAEQWIVRLSN